MYYFSKDYIKFFEELAINNNRGWFQEQKKRYEEQVKIPLEAFVNDVIMEIQKYENDVVITAKECISKINRDIRFSKDKTPYNLYCTAFISQKGKADKSYPGIYLRFSADEVGIMGGCFNPSVEQLQSIRKHIADAPGRFRSLISSEGFKSRFRSIEGEEQKRIPVEFKAAVQEEPLLAKKQFYFVSEKDSKLLVSNKLLNEILEHWHVARPVNDFLKMAIKK